MGLVVRHDEIRSHPRQPLPLPFVDRQAVRLIGANAYCDSAHLLDDIDLDIAIAKHEDLLARVPQWEILLRHEISVASSPKPFFNERVQELHGGGRDQRGRSAVAPKQAELDFLTRLKTILSQPAPAPIA